MCGFCDMHSILIKEKERYIKQGARHVFVVPYPYRRAHFLVYDEQGGCTEAWLSDNACRQAVHLFLQTDAPISNYCLYTLALTSADSPCPETLCDQEKALIRLCLDAHLPQVREKAIEQILTLYPQYKKEARNTAVLGACARYLSSVGGS